MSTRAQAAIGEVVVNGEVRVNGVKAASGSALFEGSSIRTLAGAKAIINLRAGAGVLSLESDGEVNVSRKADEINVQLSKGALRLRTRTSSTVGLGEVFVRSMGDNVYRVAVEEKGIIVYALAKPLTVLAEGQEVTLNAGQTYLSWEETAGSDQSQTAGDQTQQTKRRRRAIIIPALLIGSVITVLALTVARGEKSKVVSPVAPRR